MAYGTVKVDNITFDDGGSDQNVTVSGLYNSLTSGITVTGTISGAVVIGSTSVSGTTVAGVTVTGTTVQGASGTFTSLTGTTTQGTTATYTTGSFTSLTGTTTTGTTSSFTSGVFTTLSGATATFTSGIIASGTAAAPSLAILGDPDTGVFSPGANQLAVATNGTGRLFVDASGNVGVKTSAPFQYGAPAVDLAHIQLTSQQYSILTFGGTAGATGHKYWRLISRANEMKFQLQSVDDNGNNEATVIEVVKGIAQAIDNVQLHTNGSERLRITSAGLVGIGTSSAARAAILTTKAANQSIASGNGLISVITSNSQAADVGGSIVLGGQSTDADWVYASLSGRSENNSYAGYLAFATSASGGQHNERMRITAAGNVGIGTTGPEANANLTVYGAGIAISKTSDTVTPSTFDLKIRSADPKIGVHVTSNAQTATLEFGTAGDNANGAFINVTGADPLRFGTNNTEKARIDSSGRLLVGTSTARANFLNATETAKLQIEGAVNISAVRTDDTAYPSWLILGKTRSTGNTIVQSGDIIGRVAFEGNDGSEFVDAAFISAEVDGTPGANDMPGRLVFSTTADGAASPTERMRIKADGIILMNTTSTNPATTVGHQFTPSGQYFGSVADSTSATNTLHVYSTSAAAYRFYVGMDGTVNATNTTISAISDQRFKENIRDLDVGLNQILALQPRRFDWKPGKGKDIQNDQGFIAQEFEQIFPEMVGEWLDPAPEGEEPYKSVRADLIPVLVKAIQEQQAIINGLEARLAALEAS